MCFQCEPPAETSLLDFWGGSSTACVPAHVRLCPHAVVTGALMGPDPLSQPSERLHREVWPRLKALHTCGEMRLPVRLLGSSELSHLRSLSGASLSAESPRDRR